MKKFEDSTHKAIKELKNPLFPESTTDKVLKELKNPLFPESALEKLIQEMYTGADYVPGLVEKISQNKILEDELLQKYPDLADRYIKAVKQINFSKMLKIAKEQLITNVKGNLDNAEY